MPKLRLVIHSLFVLAVCGGLSPPAPAGERVGDIKTGKWVKKGDFAQVNIFCIQPYACVPAQDIMHSADTKVVSSPTKAIRGVCNAAGGAVDSCNLCASNPPKDQCKWWLEKK